MTGQCGSCCVSTSYLIIETKTALIAGLGCVIFLAGCFEHHAVGELLRTGGTSC